MARAKDYDFKKVILTIGTANVSGYATDGGIEVAWGGVWMTKDVGTDGEVTYSQGNDDSTTVTLTLRESSRAYRDLMTLAREQRARTGAIQPLAFYMRDLVNGDELKDRYCVFMEIPDISKGATAGDRVFVLDLPNARANAKFGARIEN